MTHDPLMNGAGASLGFQSRRRTYGWLSPLVSLAGLVATVVALAVGAILAVFTAAAVAVFALCASVVLFFAGFALRARRQVGAKARRATDPADGVIEARKVGDTWVAYGWDRTGR